MPQLCGRRVVNTRAAHQARELDQLLIAAAAIPAPYPCIAIAPPVDPAELTAALAQLQRDEFDWLVLTSRNAVRALASHGVARTNLPARLRVAAVGPATALAARDELGLVADVIPDTHSGAALAAAIPVVTGARVFLPASEIARPELQTLMERNGAVVRRVDAYRTVVGAGGSDVPALLADGQIDALTFCSSSAVDGFIARLQAASAPLISALTMPAACIGEPTLTTARSHGFTRAVAAEPQSLEGLISALSELVVSQPQGGVRWPSN